MDFNQLFLCSSRPEIASVAYYARELSGDAPMPKRSQFRPPRLAPVLGYFFLTDLCHDPHDYRFRLFGERMSVLYGQDLTGKRLRDIGNERLRQSLRSTYDRVAATKTPLYMRGRYVWPDKEIGIERLLLPMADDDGQLSTICGLVVPDVPDGDLELYCGHGPAILVGEDEMVLAA